MYVPTSKYWWLRCVHLFLVLIFLFILHQPFILIQYFFSSEYNTSFLCYIFIMKSLYVLPSHSWSFKYSSTYSLIFIILSYYMYHKKSWPHLLLKLEICWKLNFFSCPWSSIHHNAGEDPHLGLWSGHLWH